MKFEFDPNKSQSNRQKHGIDFVEAQALWDDEDRIIYPARTIDEERFILVGLIGEKHWSAIYTLRDENIRIISVRRSREEEVTLYEG
ncbi:MAG: BrnT family toxin [Caldilineae bacterium]|nr:BrnT family toxin [Anaerolineae bacterium]MCB0255254.1 BrnT family toxin [Anaerolineae bacterium]MCB9153959.1 BrnT family toxin [Caldilineae bacterium]